MLQITNIRANKETYIKALKKRNFDAEAVFSEVLKLDETRRATQSELDDILAESNKLSKEIGLLFKNGETQKANLLKQKTAGLKGKTKNLSEKLNQTVQALQTQLYNIPNIPN
ncbi:MAG TPA: serine--tRNA ligase, partial [Salinimicrobium sp.]|nr:serine--tRNA ligase [Salinimicrobium sp.]